MRQSKAFTLIEIVIVISLISLLATIGITGYNRVQNQSRTTKINADLKIVQKNINAARFASNQNLGQITGNYCSACTACSGDLRNVPDTHACALRWRNIQTRLATWNGDISNIDRDPWGSPYVVDENDGEYPTNPCRPDRIRSVGPDGIYANTDDIAIGLSMVTPGC